MTLAILDGFSYWNLFIKINKFKYKMQQLKSNYTY